MANLPILQTRSQIVGNLISGFLSRQPYVTDLYQQSVVSQFLKAVGQSQFKASAAIISMLDASSVDRAEGPALQRIANDENVPIFSAVNATGYVNITDTSFQKIYSTLFAGQPAPVAGSLTIYVNNASQFTAGGGSIYIGRGTPNSEGPLQYTSVVSVAGGAYWQINLAATSATTRFHNIGETVVLAQGGNRTISLGSIVQTPTGSSVTSVQFNTTQVALILDGEVSVSGVPIICTQAGTIGNVPAGAITQAPGLSFNASITNTNPLSTGREADVDDDIRNRIKLYRQSLARGTAVAISTAAIGVIAPDENKQVKTSSMVNSASNQATLYFDDGTGYEPLFTGAGFEYVIESAVGGELNLQLRNWPIAQARLQTVSVAPFDIAAFSSLAVTIDGVTTTHQFLATDFQVPTAGTAYEVAASINGDANVNFSANTAGGGQYVVIYPSNNLSNSIKVTPPTSGVDANAVLGFPSNVEYTLWLYKNNQPLFQDGLTASVVTRSFDTWSNSIVNNDTLTYIVDKTTPVQVILTNGAFQKVNIGDTVSSTTAIADWAQVMSNLMPGVSASVVSNSLQFTSNSGASSTASIEILDTSQIPPPYNAPPYSYTSTLYEKIFPDTTTSVSAQGQSSDYTLNGYTGQIELASALNPGDQITAGSQFTRGKIISAQIPSGTSVPGNFWMISDGASQAIPNDLPTGTQIQFTKTGTKLVINATTISSAPIGFDQVEPGDWLLVWSNVGDPTSLIANSGYWRVETVSLGVIQVDDGANLGHGSGLFVPNTNRLVFVRSAAPIQQVSFKAESLTLLQADIQSQLEGCIVDIVGSQLRISTATADSTGQLFVIAADTGGQNLQLPILTAANSVASNLGYSSQPDTAEASMPSFSFSEIGAKISDKSYTQPDYVQLGGTTYDFLEILDRYSAGSPPVEYPDSNKNERALVINYNPATQELDLLPPPFMTDVTDDVVISPAPTGSSIKTGDRFYLGTSYQFDSNDTVTVAIDQNQLTTYIVEVARKLQVNNVSTPTASSFSANDMESSLALSSTASFYDFDFANFKAWRRSNTTLTDGNYSILIQNANPGPTGDKVRIGLVYPTSVAQTALAYTNALSDAIDIGITIPVTTVRTPNWNSQSTFSVAISTTGGKDSITYTWRSGTQPNFTSANVVPGDIMILNSNASFLPQDAGYSAQVTSVSATQFTAERPTGFAAADSIQISGLLNQNGIITVTTATPNNVNTGSTVGLWGTAISQGVIRPLDGAYNPLNITSSTQFTLVTPPGTPGGNITAINSNSGVVTVSVPSHGLSVGNMILVSGVSISALNGLFGVATVIDVNTIQYDYPGSLGSAAAGGRADFQSYGPNGPTVSLASISGAGNVVTVNTVAAHGYTPGELAQISGTALVGWINSTTYGIGDMVSYSGQNYISLVASNTGNQPNISPTDWSLTSASLNGIWVINTVPTSTSFTYYIPSSGNVTGTASLGIASLMVVQANLSRGLGGGANQYLNFVQVGTTAQSVATFITQSMSGILNASVVAGASDNISVSTEDLGASGNYLSGNITSLQTNNNSKLITVVSSVVVAAGSRIVLSGMNPSSYNDTYVVLTSEVIGGSNYLNLISEILASSTATSAQSGSYVGSSPYQMLQDGERSIASSNLLAVGNAPQFFLKSPWATVPSVGEEVRLVAVSNDQLVRFWSNLVVTGLDSASSIAAAEYGKRIQVTTDTFGSSGSVQFAGGTANGETIALASSSSFLGVENSYPNGKLGIMYIPYDLMSPVTASQWMLVQNEIVTNKQIGFNSSTELTLNANSLQIISGSGSFQVLRPTTQDTTTVIKVEQHGNFFAFVGISGTSLGLATAGISEGDWIKIGGAFGASNQGIYQVVRTYGQNAFWIYGINFVEQIVELGASTDLQFYSYDSVMPGDVLNISTNLFGSVNIGSFTVAASPFPTSAQISFTPTATLPFGSITAELGANYSLVNVQEAKPLTLWKHAYAVGLGAPNLAAVIVDTPTLINRTGPSLGSYILLQCKLNFNSAISFGVDAYKYYQGLIAELTRVIYGDPTSVINYPGVKAAGATIGILPSLVKRIQVSLAVRIRSNLALNIVEANIQSAVAGYVNSLGVGAQVSLSSIVSAAGSIPGVVSVAVISPVYSSSSDLIDISANETPFIINPSTDVSVTIIGS